MNQLIGLLNHPGDGSSLLTGDAEGGTTGPDTARCRVQRLPLRIPHACIAYRQIDPPSPELLDRVLEGLKRL